MKQSSHLFFKPIWLLALFCMTHMLVFAQKKPKKAKKSLYQNITTRYNILFNANEILNLSVEGLSQVYPYKFEEILPVYLSPNEASMQQMRANMDAVIQKCDRIIQEKNRSKFVDRAYLIKGVANYYKGGYFLASEYFDYLAAEYDSVKVSLTESKAWKARCMTIIRNFSAAHQSLDSAIDLSKSVKLSRKNKSLIYATAAQLAIAENKFPEAISYLQSALEQASNSYDRIRWNYVLAQLYDNQNNSQQAMLHYDKVVKSNANFNLSFNASLNKIRIEAFNNPTEDLRTKALMRLTRDEKNEEFLDQIYYQIGNVYRNDRRYDLAIENYKKSINSSVANDVQKGISYLAIGDVSFQYKNDYLTAKDYYDTAINVLPKTYRGYSYIVRKANNLQDLAEYYTTISNQDTLQMIAKLPGADQKLKIRSIAEKIFREKHIKDSLAQALYDVMNNPKNPNYNPYLQLNRNPVSNSSFYFANRGTVQQGYQEFKRIWGSRPLVDNWRLSAESATFTAINTADDEERKQREVEEQALAQAKKDVLSGKEAADIAQYIKNMQAQVPNTPQQLLISDKLIIESYFKMGSFYRDILEDVPNAIQAFESLMRRFPNNYRSAETYYNLYRLLAKSNPEKAQQYRNELINRYSQTVYAKILTDPNFAKNYKGELAQVHENYEHVFAAFMKKQYTSVMTQSEQNNTLYPNNELAPQFDYLRAIAVGHHFHVDTLMKSLDDITKKYPKDGLVTPLVASHIKFLKDNYTYYQPRQVALTDADDFFFFGLASYADPVNKGYLMEDYDSFQRKEIAKQKALEAPKIVAKKPEKLKEDQKPVEKPSNVLAKVGTDYLGNVTLNGQLGKPEMMQTPKGDSSKLKLSQPELEGKQNTVGLGNVELTGKNLEVNAKIRGSNADFYAALKAKFTDAPSKQYYFVINVFDESAVLSSSRFGIGQFIRTYYNGNTINHKVAEFDKNQLIYVGVFATLDEVKDFQAKISPQMNTIMKLNLEDYETFVISKENLDRIKNSNDVNDYVFFYNLTLK